MLASAIRAASLEVAPGVSLSCLPLPSQFRDYDTSFLLSLPRDQAWPGSGPGGDERDRTDDPLLAKQVLSQLSYTPIFTSEGVPFFSQRFLGGCPSGKLLGPSKLNNEQFSRPMLTLDVRI